MCGKSASTTSSSSPDPQAYAAYSNLLNQAGQVAQTPFQSYGGEFTAPLNQQQQQAGSNINQYAGFAQPYIQQAAGYATQAAQPLTGAQIAQYQSPYTQQVVNATQAEFNNQNQQQLEGVRGNAAAQGALGGDREAVAEGITSGQQSLAQAPVIAGLYNQSYNTALSTAQQQQQNLGQAAYSLGNLGVAGQNAGLTGANAQLGYGTLGQSTSQAQDTALYNQFLAQAAFPYQQTQWLAGIDTGVGSQMGGTSQTTGPAPNPLSSILGLGSLGLGAWNASDKDVKENISKVGKTHDGQNLYRYRYKGSPQWHIGLIAQEVEKRHPDAVAGFGGIKHVNLKAATDDAVGRREGGRISGFAGGGGMGGMPYSSLGGTSYLPQINITSGPGAPRPPGTGNTSSSSNPMQMANQALTLEKGIAGLGGSSTFGGINYGGSGWGGDGVSGSDLASAAKAGVESGLTFDPMTGAVFARGGSVRGFDDGGGLGTDLGIGDIGGASFDDRFSGVPSDPRSTAAGLVSSVDGLRGPGAGVGNAPSWPESYAAGISPDMKWAEDYSALGGTPPTAGLASAGSPSAAAATDYINPRSVNGQPQNLTGDIIPPGGTAPPLGPATDVPSPRAGLDVSSYAPVPGTAGAPALPQEEGKQSGFGGLFGGYGSNPTLGRALMAAGFGMMASRSPYLGNAIGEGGLAGLASYGASEKAQQEAKKSEASIEDARKKLEMHADEFSKKLAFDSKKLQQQQEHQEFLEKQAEAGKVPPGYKRVEEGLHYIPGGPYDPEAAGKLAAAKKPGGTQLPAEAWGLHGDEFLKNLPPDKQNLIKGVANYSIDPKTLSVTGGRREEALNLASQYDPNFDQKTYNQRYNAVNRFATGPQGNTVRSLNVAIDHLDTLDKLGTALNNGNVQAGNQILNRFQHEFGDPRITNYNLAKSIVADEVLKAVIGSGAGTMQDREQLQKQFSAANSPAQMTGVNTTAQMLMAGQMHGLEQQYKGSTGLTDFQQRYLSPQTRERLTTGAAPAGGQPAAGSAGTPAPLVRQNGHTYQLQPDGSYKAVQ